MTMMADFLLQPASSNAAGTTTGRDAGAGINARNHVSGQDFSRILVQQRQTADIKPPAPRQKQQEPARTAEQHRAESRRDNEPVRKAEAKPVAHKASTDKPDSTQGRQKDGSQTSTDSAVNETTAEGEQVVAGEHESVPGLLDPLLEQILLAQEQSGEDANVFNNQTGEPVEEAGELGQLMAMIQGAGSHSATGTHTETAGKADGQSVSPPRMADSAVFAQGSTGAIKAETASANGELSLETSTDELPEGSQLLAAASTRAERTENSLTQATQSVKGVSVGEARADTLMRTEAVQSTQTTRAVPGQPLNMQQPGWSKELTDKVMWMSSQNLKSAEIKLNPAELGRLDIRVQIGPEQTQITFTSAHSGVRDSLEGQMHRLRELLEQQGMNNVDVEVADRQQQQQERFARGTGAAVEADGLDEELVGVSEVEQQEQGHAGLVSYYV